MVEWEPLENMGPVRRFVAKWTVFIAAGIALTVVVWRLELPKWGWIVVSSLPLPIAFVLVFGAWYLARELWRQWSVELTRRVSH